MKRVLFSPVGGTDPISANNMYDGALLHISRCYQPDVIYLYLSNEILGLHEQDNRYMYCLQGLDEMQGRHTEYHVIKRPDLVDVQDFDTFYPDFQEIIHAILQEQGDDIELLLNISSGTPAMKSALMVINTLEEGICKTIQVSTPIRKMNEHTHKGYDVETLWELDEDNRDDYENRCKEVRCPSLQQIHQERVICKLLLDYDYAGAYAAAQMLPEAVTKDYIDLLYMAHRRLLLDSKEVDKVLQNDTGYVMPVRDGRIRKTFEYALILQVKLKRCEYADFIRGLSPLLFVLFSEILKRQANVDWTKYCNKAGDKWDYYGNANTPVMQALVKAKGDFRGGYVYSSHLCVLIEELCSDQNVVMLVKELRAVEQELRNEAAHQVISVTEDTIKDKTEKTGDQIMRMIRQAFAPAGINVRSEQWDSYDDMNQVIIQRMG